MSKHRKGLSYNGLWTDWPRSTVQRTAGPHGTYAVLYSPMGVVLCLRKIRNPRKGNPTT